MIPQTYRHVVAVFLLGTLFVVESAYGDTVFFDDFSDGSVTNDTPLDRDGNPVVWTPVEDNDDGTGDASTGDYVITTPSTRGAFASLTSHADLTDTSVRAQMQLTEGEAALALFARADSQGSFAYQAGINTRSGNAYIVYNSPFPSTLAAEPAQVDLKSGDVVIQLDVIADQLSLFTWNAGEEKPIEPALQVTDTRIGSGVTGVLLDSDGPATGVFRYVHVAVPEPSTATLSCLGVVCVLAWQRKKHLLPTRDQK